MKRLSLAFGAVSIALLGGCQTYVNLDTPEAQRARQLMAEQCDVGVIRVGSNPAYVKYIRVAKGVSITDMHSINRSHAIDPDYVTVYNVKDLDGTWIEVDASSAKARDNFYFNQKTGEAVCSFDEWKGGLELTVPMMGGAPSMNSVGGDQ